MKKIFYWIFLFSLLFTFPLTALAQTPPIPANIGGTVTVDGVLLTANTDDGYTFKVTKQDGTPLVPASEDTDGLAPNINWYNIAISTYDETVQPGGVEPGTVVVLHVYHGDTELLPVTLNRIVNSEIAETINSGQITVGAKGSNTQYNIITYGPKTLTIESSDLGSTDPAAGSHSYTHGEAVPIVATPASGYVFDAWTGDVTNVANTSAESTTITMNADASIAATYSECTHSLTLEVNDVNGGTIDPVAGTTSRACDAVVTLTATPVDGYSFSGWTGDITSSSLSTSVTMDADKTVTANFTAITYILTVDTPANGSISLDPTATDNEYGEGTVVTVTATPATGYLFDAWTGSVADTTLQSTTITMNSNQTISATFIECTKTLTMEVNDPQMGSTTPEVGDSTQSCDAQVEITATPATHYYFINWTGDVADANAATTTVTMDTDQEVTANFSAIMHILTIGSSDNGTTTPAAGEHEYAEGSVVTLTAVAATGYVFSSWTGDVTSASVNPTTVEIDQAKTVTPVFAPDTDGDGIADTTEEGPSGTDTSYDGNGDGVADWEQANVVSGYDAAETYYITAVTETGNTMTFAPVTNPDAENEPSGVTFDFGYYDIYITGVTSGGSATVTIILPADAPVPNTYYKYGPTADNSTPHWYEFLYDATSGTGAEFNETENTITLNFVDGGKGDGDLTANGVIDDPGAPGISSGGSNNNCFIATAAYGSKMEPQVQILRDFRDRYMLTSSVGRTFADMYYKYSPKAASFIAEHSALRVIVRCGLLPAVGASWMMLNFGLLFTLSIFGFVCLMIFGFIKYRRN